MSEFFTHFAAFDGALLFKCLININIYFKAWKLLIKYRTTHALLLMHAFFEPGSITFERSLMKRIRSIAVAATLIAASSFAGATVLVNGSFESNNVGGSYAYGPAAIASGWTFYNPSYGGSGISGNSPAWGGTATDGSAFAFLQNVSYLTQTFSLTAASNYDVSFDLALRSGYAADQVVTVMIDGTLLGTYSPTIAWVSEVSASTLLGIGSHTLTFSGITSGDTTAFLDNVAVNAVPEPTTYALMFGGLGIIGALSRRRRARLG